MISPKTAQGTGWATPEHRSILGMRVDAPDYASASDAILGWAAQSRSRYVCVATVHMVMEAFDDPAFQSIVNEASLVTPDGVPLVWGLRWLGIPSASRVYGPTLMLHVCSAAAAAGVPIGLFGGREETLDTLRHRLLRHAPGLEIAYAYAPPFRPLDEQEQSTIRTAMTESGARIVFVGLGCPKQERWMARQAPHLDLVQVGVGAAFDFHAGRVRQAPPRLQRMGLEWAFRLAMEPRRLAGRYARHNPRFIWHFVRQVLGERYRHR